MRHLLCGITTLFLVIFAWPGYGADAKDKKDALEAKKALEKKESQWVRIGQLTGTLVGVNESTKGIRIRVDVPTLNPAAVLGLAQAQEGVALAQVALVQATAQPPRQRYLAVLNAQWQMAQAQENVARQQNQLYTRVSQEVELPTTDDLVVRLNEPLPKFNDQGKQVRLTAKDLKEAKGSNPKLPGYQADFSNLRPNQIIQVTLTRHKNALRPRPANPKNKEADADLLLDDIKPHISMIIVLADLMPDR